MQLIQDKNDPDLVAILDNRLEFREIKNQVENLNDSLKDSGYEKFRYRAELRGMKAYIRLI